MILEHFTLAESKGMLRTHTHTHRDETSNESETLKPTERVPKGTD